MIGVLSLCGASAVEAARVVAAWFALRSGCGGGCGRRCRRLPCRRLPCRRPPCRRHKARALPARCNALRHKAVRSAGACRQAGRQGCEPAIVSARKRRAMVWHVGVARWGRGGGVVEPRWSRDSGGGPRRNGRGWPSGADVVAVRVQAKLILLHESGALAHRRGAHPSGAAVPSRYRVSRLKRCRSTRRCPAPAALPDGRRSAACRQRAKRRRTRQSQAARRAGASCFRAETSARAAPAPPSMRRPARLAPRTASDRTKSKATACRRSTPTRATR